MDTRRAALLAILLLAPMALVSCKTPPPMAIQLEPTDLLPNARLPLEGILSGGQPTAEQLAAARDMGYKTVLNLRTPGEPGTGRAEVEALGLTYLELPIAGADGLTAENALAFAAALEEAERPALVHCGSGNRVGALFALKAFHADGKNAEESLEIGLATGLTRLEPAVRAHLNEAAAGS